MLGNRIHDFTTALENEPAHLPIYALAVDSLSAPRPVHGLRPVVTVQPADKLNILLRPSESVAMPVALRAFIGRGGELQRWAAPFEARNDGGFVLRAKVAELPDLQGGRYELALLVGRPAALPDNPHILPSESGGAGWQVLRLSLTVQTDASGSLAQPAEPVKSAGAASYVESKPAAMVGSDLSTHEENTHAR